MRFLLAGSERSRYILTGLIAILVFASSTFLALKYANGAFDGDYQLNATFTSAGQGLLPGSDVKIHGIDVGKVKRVRLADGQARVRLTMKKDERVPVDVKATIRPKTLFGEKFVDLDPGTPANEQAARDAKPGAYLLDEADITDTIGGFDLERVLVQLYPILQAVKPEELMTILDELASAADGRGAQTSRLIDIYSQVLRTQVDTSKQTAEYLQALATVSEQLNAYAPDLLATGDSLHQTLPDLTARSDELGQLLDSASTLSGDLRSLLEDNRPFLEKNAKEGSKTLQLVYDNRAKIGPLVTGLRQFFQVLGSVGHIPYGDGTTLAAVKFVFDADCVSGRFAGQCGSQLGVTAVGPTKAAAALRATGPSTTAGTTAAPPAVQLTAPSTGAQALVDLLGGVLR